MQRTDGYEKGRISCLCLSYNHAQFLGKCIESIWEQEYQNIEIIALDDGSPDGSAALLKEYAARSPLPMKAIAQENSGNVARNFNILIKEAQGEFLSFISMDDYYEPDAFSSKIPLFEKDASLCFVANTLHNSVDAHDNCLEAGAAAVDWDRLPHATASDLLEIEFNHIGSFYIQGGLFKNRLVQAVGCFDEDLLGDDIVLRTKVFLHLVQHPELTFKLLDRAAVNYRMHGTNIHRNRIRQVGIAVGWKNRFFPERTVPEELLNWLRNGISASIKDGDLDGCMRFLESLKAVCPDCDAATRSRYAFSVLNISDSREKRLGIPFVLEWARKKDFNSRSSVLTVLGIKVLAVSKTRDKHKRKTVKLFGVIVAQSAK